MEFLDNTPRDNAVKAEDCLPAYRHAIAHLRQSDPVFAEICRDYELLADDLNTLLQKAASSNSRAFADHAMLLDSIRGLTNEIRAALQRSGLLFRSSQPTLSPIPQSGEDE